MRRGRPPKGLEDSLQEYVEIEYKFVEDYPEDDHFENDDALDLLENMGNYTHIEELEDE